MIGVLRLVVAVGAAVLALYVVRDAWYAERVFVAFAASSMAAAAVREAFLPSHRPLAALAGDLAVSALLALLMILAARAAGRVVTQAPSPVLPALVWPLVDLWRPHGRRRVP